jgi:hypothetical protein
MDKTPLPPAAATPEEDEDLFSDFPWVDGPIKMDYGYNVWYASLCRALISQSPS